MISLPASRTALVLIDLQKGIVGRALAPYAGDDVVARGRRLAGRFRAAGAPVVLVNVAFAPDFADALRTPVDRPFSPPPGGFAEDWTELVDSIVQLIFGKHSEIPLQIRTEQRSCKFGCNSRC